MGFYSAFMVADTVTVTSAPAAGVGDTGGGGHMWSSDGSGKYSVTEAPSARQGSQIVLNLKESCLEYADPERIQSVINKVRIHPNLTLTQTLTLTLTLTLIHLNFHRHRSTPTSCPFPSKWTARR